MHVKQVCGKTSQRLRFIFTTSHVGYRSSVQDSTGETKSFLMLGREVELPTDLLYGRHDTPKLLCDSPSEYAKNLQETLYDIHELAKPQLLKAGERQNKKYDHYAKQNQYKIKTVSKTHEGYSPSPTYILKVKVILRSRMYTICCQ